MSETSQPLINTKYMEFTRSTSNTGEWVRQRIQSLSQSLINKRTLVYRGSPSNVGE